METNQIIAEGDGWLIYENEEHQLVIIKKTVGYKYQRSSNATPVVLILLASITGLILFIATSVIN